MFVSSPAAVVGGDTAIAMEREKHSFLARNLDRCGYLRVQFEASWSGDILIVANFTLDGSSQWHRSEARLSLARPGEAGLEPRIVEAFALLEEGIGTSRIARLFAPLTAAQRMGTGRRD